MALYSLGDLAPEIDAEAWVAPSADVIGKVRLGKGVSIWFGAVLRGDYEWISVGEGSNIQDGCVCHTDRGAALEIGANCTIGHKAILHGCKIGAQSLIGMGAVILNNAVIGSGCLIGAHALIPEGKVIADGALVLGAPGKPVRILSAHEQAGLLQSAQNYQRNRLHFQNNLKLL